MDTNITNSPKENGRGTDQEILTWKHLLKDKKTFLENLKRMGIIWVVNLKSVILNKYIVFEVIFFFIVAIMFSIIIAPVNISGGVFTILGICLPTAIILGACGYNARKSTIYSNMNMSGTTRNLFYFGQLLTAIIISNILALFFWGTIAVIGTQEIFLGGWIWQGIPRVGLNPFKYWTFLNIIYITQVTAGIAFSTYFFISRFARSKVSYYIMVLAVLIIGLIFGGSINSYFNKPHYYSHFDLSAISDDAYYVDYTSKQIVIQSPESFEALKLASIVINEHGIEPSGGLMPKTVFIPTLFNPFYGIGEFTSEAVTLQMTQSTSLLTGFNVVCDGVTETFQFAPTVKWYSWYSISFKGEAWMWTMVLIQPYITALVYFLIGLLLSWIDINKSR